MFQTVSLSSIFLATLIAFLFGVYIAPKILFELDVYFWLFIALVVFLLVFYQELSLRVLSLVLIGVLLGASYFHIIKINLDKDNIKNIIGETVVLHGAIVDEINISSKYQKISVGHLKVNNSSYKGKVLIFAQKYPRYKIGDSLEVQGELQEPPVFEDFDYKQYLEKEKIFVLITRPEKVVKIKPVDLNLFSLGILKIKSVLFQIRLSFMAVLNRILIEPYGAFLAGLLVGAREEIPKSLLEKFNQTGVTHIIAISGYNISIIIAALLFLGKNLARRILYPLLFVIIIGFVVLVGGQPSIVRAAVMAGLLILALTLGRKADAVISLVVAGVLMVLLNPYILRFDVGFQLSFLATFGLIVFYDKFAEVRFIKKIPRIFKEALIATLSATVLVLPILAYNFERIPLVSPLVNMLILPAVPPAMALGFIAGILGFVWFGLGQIAGWLAFIFLYYIVFVVELFSKLSFVSIEIEKFSWIWIALYYLGVVWLWRYWQKRRVETDK